MAKRKPAAKETDQKPKPPVEATPMVRRPKPSQPREFIGKTDKKPKK